MERRNRRSIVLMQFGSKNSYQNALFQLTWAQNPFDNFSSAYFFVKTSQPGQFRFYKAPSDAFFALPLLVPFLKQKTNGSMICGS
jgi:hypothetical protein